MVLLAVMVEMENTALLVETLVAVVVMVVLAPVVDGLCLWQTFGVQARTLWTPMRLLERAALVAKAAMVVALMDWWFPVECLMRMGSTHRMNVQGPVVEALRVPAVQMDRFMSLVLGPRRPRFLTYQIPFMRLIFTVA